MVISGDLRFNPSTDDLTAPNGKAYRLILSHIKVSMSYVSLQHKLSFTGKKFKLESPHGDELPVKVLSMTIRKYIHSCN